LLKAGNHPNKPRVLITGPTGMASVLINGITIHSAFDFKFGHEYISLSDKKLDEYRVNLADLKIVIVDEISMLDSDMLYKIHRRLVDIFQCRDPFGGMSVILVGDLLQLPPIYGNHVFKPPMKENFKIFHDACPLWPLFEAIVLQHNHRQGEESKWADTLNNIRVGIFNEADKALLDSRIVDPATVPDDCCHIFYTNFEVHQHNMRMLDDLDTPEHRIPAIIKTPMGYDTKTKKHGTVDSTNFLEVLVIKKGARVMLVFNINTCDNLVNGVLGTVQAIIQPPGARYPECIIVQFDQDFVGVEHRANHQGLAEKYKNVNGTPIFRKDLSYNVGAGKKAHNAQAKIVQFPLRLAWASTAHKMQGQTVKAGTKVVLHWSSRFPNGMFYVMLGRSQRLEDILIAGHYDEKQIKCDSDAKEVSEELFKKAINNVANLDPWFHSQTSFLKVVMVNIRSLNAHLGDIAADPIMMSSDLIFLCETWVFPAEDTEKFALPGFQLKQLAIGRGKGVAIYIKDNCSITDIKMTSHDKLQFIKVLHQNTVICSAYRSNNCEDQHMNDLVEEIVNDIHQKKILMGDFNLNTQSPEFRRILGTPMDRSGFKQLIMTPTHTEGHLLDLLFVNFDLPDSSVFKHYPYYTDHDAICLKVPKTLT
jgi:hypothetical protein